jgi:hypothetical protein
LSKNWKLKKKDYLCPIKIKDKLFEILVRMEEWTVGCRAVLKTVARNGLQVRILSLPQPRPKKNLPLRITVSTYGFGPYGGSSILSGVTKMVIWPSGLGAGLQNL